MPSPCRRRGVPRLGAETFRRRLTHSSPGCAATVESTSVCDWGTASEPDTPVVCIDGDGSFLMTIQELSVAVREELDITVAVLNNEYIGMRAAVAGRLLRGRRMGQDTDRFRDCRCRDGDGSHAGRHAVRNPHGGSRSSPDRRADTRRGQDRPGGATGKRVDARVVDLSSGNANHRLCVAATVRSPLARIETRFARVVLRLRVPNYDAPSQELPAHRRVPGTIQQWSLA